MKTLMEQIADFRQGKPVTLHIPKDPELLVAAQKALAHMEKIYWPQDRTVVTELRVAIAKAWGRHE